MELWSKQACPDRLIQPQLAAGGWVHQHAGGVLSLPDRKRGARGEQVLGRGLEALVPCRQQDEPCHTAGALRVALHLGACTHIRHRQPALPQA